MRTPAKTHTDDVRIRRIFFVMPFTLSVEGDLGTGSPRTLYS